MSIGYTEDEKLLIKRALDKQNSCYIKGISSWTGFLNEREQDIMLREIKPCAEVRNVYYGGYEDAQRQILVFLSEYDEIEYLEPLSAIRATYYKSYDLTHRDFLGAILGLGISREKVGDILIDKEKCRADIIISSEIKDYILNTLASAGRASLNVSEISIKDIEIPTCEIKIIVDTVASARADAIVAAGFGMSREKAAQLIKTGNVYANRRQITDTDKQISDQTVINAKGFGKFKVFLTGGVSKKGRMYLRIEKYI